MLNEPIHVSISDYEGSNLQLEMYYSCLTSLLVDCLHGQLGLSELSEHSKKVMSLVKFDQDRTAFGAELSQSTYWAVIDVYNETLLDPYDVA